jgi:hypothetical protein
VARADERWQRDRRTFPLLRWILGLVLLATTLPGTHSVSVWWSAHAVVVIIAAVVVFGPDLVSLSVGSVKMDLLRETRDDMREVRGALTTLQVQKASLAAQQTQGFSMDDLIRLLQSQGVGNLAALINAEAGQVTSEQEKSGDVPAAEVIAKFIQTTPDQDHVPGTVDHPDTGG